LLPHGPASSRSRPSSPRRSRRRRRPPTRRSSSARSGSRRSKRRPKRRPPIEPGAARRVQGPTSKVQGQSSGVPTLDFGLWTLDYFLSGAAGAGLGVVAGVGGGEAFWKADSREGIGSLARKKEPGRRLTEASDWAAAG